MGDQDATPTEPIRRAKRDSASDVLARIPAVWKLLVAVMGLIGLGASGYAYAGRFATRATMDEQVTDIRRELRTLREVVAGREIEVAVVRTEVAATRAEITAVAEDVRTLLGHVLANPPRRGR